MALKLPQQEDDLAVSHEINVVPFIDVMLVLLIIFMVAAPLATVSVPVDLPGSTAPPTAEPADPLYLTLQEDLALVLGEEQTLQLAELGEAIDKVAEDKQQRILLRADKNVAYGDMMDVLNALSKAGYLKVALVGLEAVSQGATK